MAFFNRGRYRESVPRARPVWRRRPRTTDNAPSRLRPGGGLLILDDDNLDSIVEARERFPEGRLNSGVNWAIAGRTGLALFIARQR